MSTTDVIVLCSDDDIGESNALGGRNDFDAGKGISRIKETSKSRKGRHHNSKCTSKESGDIRSSNSHSTGHSASSMLDQVGSPADESSLLSAPTVCPVPLCRQFWKSGNFEVGQGQSLKAAYQNVKNHLCVHPMFLHSNATSHKWAFGAVAELLDNCVDEIQNGATSVYIDKISNPRDGSPALLIQDDGGGMDPEAIRHCMSFGFSDKQKKHAIGQYGNGFKTSSMRLGADAIVFSRHMKERTLTQSIGLLSFTFLTQMDYDRIVVPMVDYEFSSSTATFGPILAHGKEHFSSNLSLLLEWSPYETEEGMLKQFDDIGNHGTKIIIYNLWLNDDGDMELDFDSDPEDIHITGDPKLLQAGGYGKQVFDQHIANRYQYSLRAYSSILYLRLPQTFNIILRGQVVEHHNIANDLKFPEFILYRPHTGGVVEAAVVTTIGFLKEAPHMNIHGFNIYHRNRLILPFFHALKNMTNSTGRGVVGVLEANYIEPTHNKQDFEKTSLFQKLEDRLKQMTLEYWRLHCELIGYQPAKRNHASLPSQDSPSSSMHSSLEEPVLLNHCCPVSNSFGAAPAVGSVQDPVASTPVDAKRKRKSADMYQNKSQQGFNVKRKECDPPEEVELARRHAVSKSCATDTQYHGEIQPEDRIKNQVHDPETMNLMQENRKLRSRVLEFEKKEVELNLKVQQLRSELEDIQRRYEKLLAESGEMDIVKVERSANEV